MKSRINELTEQIIGAGIEVHKLLGPGLLESAYQRALAHELRLRNIAFEEQKLCPVTYKDLVIDDALLEVHDAQVLTYLKFSGTHIGLLMNFRSTVLIQGLRRLALRPLCHLLPPL